MTRIVAILIETLGAVGLAGSAVALAFGRWWGLATGVAAMLILWAGFLAEERVREKEGRR